jgi:hypothetical protein
VHFFAALNLSQLSPTETAFGAENENGHLPGWGLAR